LSQNVSWSLKYTKNAFTAGIPAEFCVREEIGEGRKRGEEMTESK